MKKIFFTTVLLLCFTISYGQENNQDQPLNNEMHLNVLMPIAAKSFEFSYERILNEESSVGATMLFAKQSEMNLNFAVSPYFRKFFSRGYATGFFVETFAMINSGEYEREYYDGNTSYYRITDYTDIAFGVGIGGKFITKRNFIGMVNAGIARNLGSNSPDIIGKGGVTFGYRF